jgi:two-component system, NarL family, captular synthesis response regulator RcsB
MTSAPHDVNIVIADDHPIVLLAVSDALRALPGFQVLGMAQSGSELLRLLDSVRCDLIVTDFTMQSLEADEDGLRLIGRLRRLYPETHLVVFTMLGNGGILHRLCQMGVAGIVGKDEDTGVLGKTCQRVIEENRTILSPGMAARLALQDARTEVIEQPQALSPKELEVVRLFAQGMTVTEIAQRLNRSITTIATQKRTAMRKLRIATNVDLLKYATEQGF